MTKLAAFFLQAVLAALATAQDIEVLAEPNVGETTRLRVEEMALVGLERLTPLFPGTPSRPITVHVHRSTDSLPRNVRVFLHEGTAGLALLRQDRIYLILDEARRSPPHDLRTVVEHELVHVLLDQFAGGAAPYVSRWFHEGLAQELSGGPYIGMSEDDLVLTTMSGRLLRWGDLQDGFPDDRSGLRRAYAQSFSFVGFLRRKMGLSKLLEAARLSTDEDGFRGGFTAMTESPLLELDEEWRDYLRHGSGAAWRFVLDNCFSYVMIGAVVLLALAGMRRWRRDELARAKLELEDRLENPADLEER